MAVKDLEISSFIFLSGCDKTYNGQIRAHVLKRHLKIRKENSLVPRRYIQDKTYKRSRINGGHHELAEITSEIPSQGRSQATVSCTPNTLRKADLCGVSPGNKCLLGAEAYCISSAVACTSSAIPLVEDHQGPRDLLVPRASRTLFPDFTERQAYLYHHCMDFLNCIELNQTDNGKFSQELPPTFSVLTLCALNFTPSETSLLLDLWVKKSALILHFTVLRLICQDLPAICQVMKHFRASPQFVAA
jgi:hypothetical protein